MTWRNVTIDELNSGKFIYTRTRAGKPIQVWDGPGKPPVKIIKDSAMKKEINEQRILRRLDGLSSGLMCVCVLQGFTIVILVMEFMR